MIIDYHNYKLIDIIIDKDINEKLKCRKCHDILRSPIQCNGGHSWCLDCIIKTKSNVCPICPHSINPYNPQIDITARDEIGILLCRCPFNNIDASHDEEESKYEKNDLSEREIMKESLSINFNKYSDDICCEWIGKYKQLEDHLKDCNNIPRPCIYAVHGCQFDGSKISLENHYSNSYKMHLYLLSNQINLMKKAMEAEKVVSDQLWHDLYSNDKKIKDCYTVNGSYYIKWEIMNVRRKLGTKMSVLSERFSITAPNGNKYKMNLEAEFGLSNGKDLSVYINHVLLTGYSNEMPIRVGGTVFILHNQDPLKNIIKKFEENAWIKGIEYGSGWNDFCDDLTCKEGFTNNDQIVITVKVKINSMKCLITTI